MKKIINKLFAGSLLAGMMLVSSCAGDYLDTARWSVTVAVRLSMYAASGAAIRAKVPKPYSLPKPMPKYRAGWFRIRITIRFRNCLPIISWLSLPIPYR